MLPHFRVRNMRRPPCPVSSHLSLAGSPNLYLDGIVRISAREYDTTILVHPDATLKYVDEDDEEIVTVGSSLELAQRLEDPVVPPQTKLGSMPVTKAVCSAEHKHSADSPLLHVFEIDVQGNSAKVWQEIVRKSEQIRSSGTFQEPQYLERGAVKKFNEPKTSAAFQPSESFHLQAHSMKQVAPNRNHKPLRINTYVRDSTPPLKESHSPYLERCFSKEVLSPYMAHNDWENLAATPICHQAPPSLYMDYSRYEAIAPTSIYKEPLSPYMNNHRANQIPEDVLRGRTNSVLHSEIPRGSPDYGVVPGGWRSLPASRHLLHSTLPVGITSPDEYSQHREPGTQNQSDEQSSLLKLFEAELARLWKDPGHPDLTSRLRSEIYGDEHHDSSTVEKVQHCVEKLKDLGFGENSNGGVQRLVVYAQAAEGNVSDAIDLIDEEQQAYKEWAGH